MSELRFTATGKQYEALLAIEREGSFSGAAAALGVSQPSLSQQIQRMETELGTPLFLRQGRKILPTEAGKILLRCGRQIRDLEENAGYALDALRGEGAPLVIGTTPYRALTILPEAICRFRALSPVTPIRLEEMTAAELLEACRADRVELAFTALPQPGGEEYGLFDCTPVLTERLVLAVPEALPFEGSGIADAPGLPFAALGEGQLLRRKFEQICAAAGFRPEIPFTCTDVQTLARMVSRGTFAAVLPEGILGEWDGVRLFPLPGTDEGLRQIGVLTRRGRALSPAARRLIGLLRDLGDRRET